MNNGFFVFKFMVEKDYWCAKSQGPWIISGSFLFLGDWKPKFRPLFKSLSSTFLWIRLPNLLVEYSMKEKLEEIGNNIGQIKCIDHKYTNLQLAPFAHICVQIDLQTPIIAF